VSGTVAECLAPAGGTRGWQFEWTDNRCHEPTDDVRRYDCEALCQKKGGTLGRCVVSRDYCRARQVRNPDAIRDSASCVCDPLEA
jgi:hypothetical protein